MRMRVSFLTLDKREILFDMVVKYIAAAQNSGRVNMLDLKKK